MRRRPRTALGAMALAVVVTHAGCAGQRAEPKPVASLAATPAAAAAFDAIREAWADADRTTPSQLRSALTAFLARFPNDGLVPFARAALAIAAMDGGDLSTADAQLDSTEAPAAGSAHSLWTVARARRSRLKGDPEGALTLLRPLVGKIVDPMVLSVFERELALTALATHRDYEAVSYMDAWLRASTDEDKADAIKSVTGMVQHLDRDVLVGALLAMHAQRARFGYGVDIERILAERLVHIATTSGDAQLARILLDADPEAMENAGSASAQLGELATSRRGLNVVEGRTIGLLLPTDSPGLRDESADVLRGVLWALGLPRGSRPPPQATTERTGAPDAGARETVEVCGTLEPAPALGEPGADDAIRLVTRDDAGSMDRTEVSLDELAGEGAALVIAGLDGTTAARALRWGQAHEVPVITLVSPEYGNDPGAAGDASPAAASAGSFGFLLGEPRARVLEALLHGAPSIAGGQVAPVADASEMMGYPPEGGPAPGLAPGLAFTFAPPVSCDMPATQAGSSRFPLAQWETERTHAWLVSGSPDCAEDVVGELAGAHARGVVALTLEAADLPRHPPTLHVTTVQAGVVPTTSSADPREEEVRRFASALGRTGWWSALGRDAATLARAAALTLPLDSVSEARAVAERRATARAALGAARARLWTSEAAGWSSDRTLKRTLCTIDSPPR